MLQHVLRHRTLRDTVLLGNGALAHAASAVLNHLGYPVWPDDHR